MGSVKSPVHVRIVHTICIVLLSVHTFGQKAADNYTLAKQHYADDEYESAAVLLDEAIALDREADYFLLRGDCFHKLEQFESALADYNFAEQLGNNSPDLYLNRGICLVSVGLYEQARLDLRLVLSRSENAKAFYYLGVIDYMNYDHKSAEENLTEAIWHNEGYMEAFYLRAATYAEWGKLQKARWDYESAIELKPDFFLSKLNLAVVMIDMLDHYEAEKQLTDLINMVPDFIDEVYYYRGEARFALRDLDGACEDWNAARELGDEDSEKNYVLICEKKKDRIRKKKRTYVEF
jgi:tetratricopeptide (TPR) repeat protein